ncbi:MAG: hypothetical protein CMD68_02285 [Gammaproteobacteria bacterium]|nr:hypothetical protein [Gammaproteobacteria bacterium]|tara:strand:- start:31 stop:1038 length:1008 start_codon:yes stop_codon:yes gene_type:complete
MKNILIISDGIPGHYNQSKGVASILSSRYPSNITIINLKFFSRRLRGFITVFSRFLMRVPNRFTAKITSFFYLSINTDDMDLIIAAGGKTAPLTASLKILRNIKVIQLGSPRGLHSSLFDAHVTIQRYFDDPSNIVAAISPNIYSPSSCAKAAEINNLKDHVLFLIGGKGIGYSYENSEWKSLIEGISKIYKDTNLPITIVTSRRTDPEVEKKIKFALKDLPLDNSAWFHDGAKNFNLAALFGAAKNIFVTEDSAMMISESISSGKPVTTLYPKSINSPPRYEAQIQKYLDLNFISRKPIEEFSFKEVENSSKNVQNHISELCNTLEERIQWQEA